MRELNIAIVVSLILLAVGAVCFYFGGDSFEFNFQRAELKIDGLNVSEKLFYEPGQSYHTLYRTFLDPVFVGESDSANSVVLKNVVCEKGYGYVQIYSGNCYGFDDGLQEITCLSHTEPNEYGCSFGDNYGFFKGSDYWIAADYELHPDNLFRLDGNNYVKFVVYSPGKHKKMGANFVTSQGIVRKEVYYPNENVIVYIPYEGESSDLNVLTLKDFEFDSSHRSWGFFFAILPGFLFFGIWYFFGKETTEADLPGEMSFYPRERRPWQIAAYFNPPFSVVDKNFISAMLMEFYHKKFIDVKLKEKKQVLIKLNGPKKLDEFENKFYEVLIYLREQAKEGNFEGDYFNLTKVSQQFTASHSLRKKFIELQKDVAKEGKNYLSKTASYLLFPIFLLIYLGYALFGFSVSIIPLFLFLLVYAIFLAGSSLFIRFKGDYYKEYQQWQAFKKWLNGSFAMKHEGPEAVKLWDHYLVYSTALGVSEKVIKELKARHLISEKDYNLYLGMHHSSMGFATASGAGGHGGAGGGGVGGGGGGGR